MAFLWLLLFSGGCILPSTSGILLSVVPHDYRTVSSSFTLMTCNIFGYFLSLCISGFIMQVMSFVTPGIFSEMLCAVQFYHVMLQLHKWNYLSSYSVMLFIGCKFSVKGLQRSLCSHFWVSRYFTVVFLKLYLHVLCNVKFTHYLILMIIGVGYESVVITLIHEKQVDFIANFLGGIWCTLYDVVNSKTG